MTGLRTARASFAQERLYFLNELDPGNPGYVIALALRLTGELDAGALRAALRDIVDRHEVLRTGFGVADGVLCQRVRDAGGFEPDLVSTACTADLLRHRVAAEARRPFALADGEVVRASVVSGGERDHALVLLVHHIACDGWSVGILLDDLATCYNARVRGDGAPLPPAESFVDYALAEREAWANAGPDALAYWRDQLAGAPQLALPTDRPRPPVLSHRGAVLRRTVGTEFVDKLAGCARDTGASLFSVLVAAYATVLAAYSRQDEVVIGVPVANRLDERAEALVGCLVNTLPLRIDVASAPTFAELVGQVRDTTLTAFADQDVPFEQIVRSVDADRQLSHAPLFQASCTLQNFPFALPDLAGVEVREVDVEIDAAKFDVGLTLDVSADDPFLRLEYSTDLFDVESMTVLLDHVVALLGSVGAAEPTMVDSAEARLVTETFNTGPRPPAQPRLLARFEEHARRSPAAVALRHSGQDLSYAELDGWATRIARGLRDAGVSPGDLVGLLLRRSPAVIAAVLGVWKLGAAYVPLDPGYPRQRLGLITADSGLPVLLAEPSTVDLAGVIGPDVPALDVHTLDGDGPLPAPAPVETAYVIYTSGSTGRPKGVLVGHQGLTELFSATPGGLDVGAEDVWLCAHSFSFDFSVWEMWGALAYGGKVVVADPADIRDPDRLAALVHAERVTVLSQTPGSLYRLLPPFLEQAQIDGTPLRYVVSGGEPLSWPRLAGLLRRVEWLETRFVNMYGITEGTVHVTAVSVTAEEVPRMRAGTVGRPLPSGRCYVLDDRRRPAGVNVPGELYIGGALVARGYVGNPELTKERFLPDPFSANGSVMYRTGDVAKWTADGEVVHLGRNDGQVQIRGHRVECAEVEQAFLRSPAVRACVVAADEDELVAFVCGGVERQLRETVREVLPDYMVPSRIVPVDAIPLTAHGKVDVARLLALRPAPADRPAPVANSAEERIRALWADVLGRPDVGPTDNFFDLGGHSFALITLQQRMADAGFAVSVTDLFRFGTVRACAARLAATPSEPDTAAVAASPGVRRQATRAAALRSARAREVAK